MKYKSVPVRFTRGQLPLTYKIKRHFIKHQKTYLLAGGVLLTTLVLSNPALASSGIDAGARRMYFRVLAIGKWIIIIKGTIDTMQSALQGDFKGAGKTFLAYALIYGILWAYPWVMDEVEMIFKDL